MTADISQATVREVRIDQRHTGVRHHTCIRVSNRATHSNDLACIPRTRVGHGTHALNVTDVSFEFTHCDTGSVGQRCALSIDNVTAQIHQLAVNLHDVVVRDGTASDSRVVRSPRTVIRHVTSSLEVTNIELKTFDLDRACRFQRLVVRDRSVSDEVVFCVIRTGNRHQTFDLQGTVVRQGTTQHTEVRGIPRTLIEQFTRNRTGTIDRTVTRRQRTPVGHLNTNQRHRAVNRHRSVRVSFGTVDERAHRRFRIDVNHH